MDIIRDWLAAPKVGVTITASAVGITLSITETASPISPYSEEHSHHFTWNGVARTRAAWAVQRTPGGRLRAPLAPSLLLPGGLTARPGTGRPAPQGPPGPRPAHPAPPPHLLVALHEAADALALHLPLGLLQLLPQLLLLALLVAVFLLPTVEAPHWVGPAFGPPTVGSFAHLGGRHSPDRPQTRATSGQAEARLWEDAEPAWGERETARARSQSPPPSF